MGQQLDNVGWHYSPANPKGCMQYQEPLGSKRDHYLLLFCKVLGFPAVVLGTAMFVAFIVLLLATCFIPCCFCCHEVGFYAWLIISAVLVGIPFLALSIIWLIIGLVLWLILWPFGAGETHLQFLVSVPFMTVLSLGESLSPMGNGD